MAAVVKRRNMLGQVGLMIITLGIYSIFWFYWTACELKALANDETASPGLWTVLLFIPIAGLYSYYKYCSLYEEITPDKFNRWLLFVLWIVFSPAVWFIVQSHLNSRAGEVAVTTA